MNSLTLAGHPFAPIGMGEHMRAAYRAFRSVAIKPNVFDIYKLHEQDAQTLAEMRLALKDELSPVNIFCINGDEAKQAKAHLRPFLRKDSYNIIYPMWELAQYPQEWADELNQFDEIWAPTRFIFDSIRPKAAKPLQHMPISCEVMLSSFLSRRYFGIPAGSYTFLFFFDFRSYLSRKNPEAVIEAFRRALKQRPHQNATLVIKMNGVEHEPDKAKALLDAIADIGAHVVPIGRTMSHNEIKNLIRCCDCFVSLHRAEGFGLGLAEAMYLGKPVIATGYSGNMDFMDADNSLPVNYQLIPVEEGAYPFWQNQVWADPDIDHAAFHMGRLMAEPGLGCAIGRRGSLRLRRDFSFRKIGLAYAERVRAISQDQSASESPIHFRFAEASPA